MNIYLSAGHKGGGTGANSRRNGKEAELTIQFRDKLVEALKTKLSTRDRLMIDDNNAEESRVIRHINNFCGKKGVAFEFHFDSSTKETANGSSVVIADEASEKSEQIANDLAPLVSDLIGVRNRGVKRECDTYHKVIGFLRQTSCPAVLIELCFLSSDNDMDRYYSSIDRLVGAMSDYIAVMARQHG